MAGRRMFARTVVTTGRFTRLSVGAQALYYALGMEADDDGFAEGLMVLRMFGSEEADLRDLEKMGYVKVYGEDLITYIVDWDTNNQIRKDRYRESRYAYLLKEAPEETPQKAVSSEKAVSQKKAPDAQEAQAEVREAVPQVGGSPETAASHQGRAAREGGAMETAAAPQQDSGRGADGAMETTAEGDGTVEPAPVAGSGDLPVRSLGMTDGKGAGQASWEELDPELLAMIQRVKRRKAEMREQEQREKEALRAEREKKGLYYIDPDKLVEGLDLSRYG